MKAIKHGQLDDRDYADAVKDQGINATLVENLTGRVPHVGFGGASKSVYTSPKTGKPVYVLERNGAIACDSYVVDFWLFAEDFSAAEAAAFLAAADAEKGAI